MVSSKWAGSALIALLSTGALAIPAIPPPNKAQIKERQLATIDTRPFTRVPTLFTGFTLITRTLPTTTRSTTPIVYTTPVYTTPQYTTPYGYTTPPYGYTTPGTTSTTTTRSTTTTSTRTSATPKYTPVVGANNTCYNRIKIETLQRSDPDQFNMLLLAWSKLTTTPDSDPFGFYQIAGIHGAPYVPWQWGNTAPYGGPYAPGRGYCTHHSVLFTTWHRPYMLLLEQALFHAAMAIANTFVGSARTQYLAAAGRVRLPYWDWSDPVTQSYLPPITMQQTVTVIRPDSFGNPVSASIHNPLWAYNFLSSSSVAPFPAPWNSRMSTRRYPTSGWGDQSPLASSNMQSGFAGRVTQTYNAFMSLPYNLFSNRVEGIHDSIHGAIGGGGQMGLIAYSAFDPIFWLHHCNVDRLMAMYQATQPATWLTSAAAVATYARPVPPHSIDDTNTELYPFMRADGTWWRSTHTNPASSIWGMNYGYAEVPCSYRTRTPQDLDIFTTQQINTLYGPRRPTTGVIRDWQVRLIIDEGEIPGGYDIYVYGGAYGGGRPEDPYKDPYRDSYIGSLSSMSPGAPDQYKSSRIRYVDVSLNAYLQNTSYYESDPYKITEYITKDLYYTIIANDKPCAFEDLYTAKIAVYSRDYYDSGKPDVLPYYISDPYYYLNVTESIPGGIKNVEDALYPVKIDGTREKPWADFNSTSPAQG